MKTNFRRAFIFALMCSFGILAGATLAVAATTIGTNITTAGSITASSTFVGGPALDVFTGDPLDTTHSVGTFANTVVPLDVDNGEGNKGLQAEFTVDPQVDSIGTGRFVSLYTSANTPAANTKSFNELTGQNIVVNHNGSGNIDEELVGSNIDFENNNTGHVANMYGVYMTPANDGGGTVGNMYGVWSDWEYTTTPATNAFTFYSTDLSGKATNPYYSWFDSQGVRRVKEDSSVDGIGQAIEALYNNQFSEHSTA
jgi:hypothetical protein